jgi:hypothetical protein
MPSAGVSDGVQTAITEKFPGTIFCPVETSGDGRVNFYSRVQMYLFKAKQAAVAELERACQEHGVTIEQVRERVQSSRRLGSALHKAPHAYAGCAADLVAEVAPTITLSRVQRWRGKLAAVAERSTKAARQSPHMVVAMFKNAVESAPEVAARVKEDVAAYREVRRAKKAADQRAAQAASHVDAAAE